MDQDRQIERPKVSVVIPVYNTEAYVEEAVRSIMNQTLREIEIIIIDDGSTDNSLSVIKKLSLEDNRINYFSQPNMGQSVARNVGIDRAQGDYIYFMDSDDVLIENTLEKCYQKCVDDDLDFIFFDAKIFGDTAKMCVDYNRRGLFVDKIYRGIEIINILLNLGKYRVPPWLYLINRSFLIKEKIIFHPLSKLYEDQIFSARIYLMAERVAYIPAFFFQRRIREHSLMTNSYSIDQVRAYFTIADELKKLNSTLNLLQQQTIHKIVFQMIDAAIYNANTLSFQKRLHVFWMTLNRYPFYVTIKSYIVLLFPYSIKIKSLANR